MSAQEDVHPAEVLAAMLYNIGGDDRYPLNERAIMMAFAQFMKLPFVDLDPLKIDAKLAPQLLSRPFARKHNALIVAADERNVTVAVANPMDHGLIDDLMTLVRRNPRLVLSTPSEIQRLITDFYGFRGAVAAAEEQVTTGVDIGNLERLVTLSRVEEIEADRELRSESRIDFLAEQFTRMKERKIDRGNLDASVPKSEKQAVFLGNTIETPCVIRSILGEVANFFHPVSAPRARIEIWNHAKGVVSDFV